MIEKTGGNADVDIALRGSGKEATLSGQIAVRDFTTTVDFTQVTYTMPRPVIEVRNNHLTAEGVPLYDPEKNEGLFSIDLNLEHLSNISYSVKVLPKELMVLNTTSKDNDLFYGRIFASGSATIAGSKGGVKMDIVATTEGRFRILYASFGTVECEDGRFRYVRYSRTGRYDRLSGAQEAAFPAAGA